MRRNLFLVLTMALALTLGGLGSPAQAKRLGGGKAVGTQRSDHNGPAPADTPPRQNQNTAQPTQPNQTGNPTTSPGVANNAAAPAAGGMPAAAGAAATTAGKRSWLGPVAGLAAGLGLAALASHLGLGEELANFMTLALLAVVTLFAVRWLIRRFAKPQAAGGMAGPQWAGATAQGSGPVGSSAFSSLSREALTPGSVNRGMSPTTGPHHAAAMASSDHSDIERLAKLLFLRMQAANDANRIEDLRRFTTPELFADLQADLQARGHAPQQTDVVQLHAQVVETAHSATQSTVSVRFHGLIRETPDSTAQAFDETWHMTRGPDADSEWRVAGLTPRSAG